MSKVFKIIMLAMAAVVLVVVIFIASIGHEIKSASDSLPKNEAATQNFLLHELATLPVPPSCTETTRSYQKGDLDAGSTWFVTYTCQTTGGIAYQSIMAALVGQKFRALEDHSLPVTLKTGQVQQALTYYFRYANSQFAVNYTFDEPSSYYKDVSSLEASPVTSINLSLSRP